MSALDGFLSGTQQTGNMDGNSLVAALAGDAASVGTAFIAADAAKSAIKNTAKSPNASILVVGAVAIAIVIAVVLLKK